MTNGMTAIHVASMAQTVFVRVKGRGTFQNSQSLRKFAGERIEIGSADFVIDLAQCAGMDSTFLGVLAGIALRLRQNEHGGSLRVVNAGDRNRELLQTMGLDRLFAAISGVGETDGVVAPADAEFQVLPGNDWSAGRPRTDEIETAKLMLQAHEDLIRADQRNQPRFANVTGVLREQIERKRPQDSEDA